MSAGAIFSGDSINTNIHSHAYYHFYQNLLHQSHIILLPLMSSDYQFYLCIWFVKKKKKSYQRFYYFKKWSYTVSYCLILHFLRNIFIVLTKALDTKRFAQTICWLWNDKLITNIIQTLQSITISNNIFLNIYLQDDI